MKTFFVKRFLVLKQAVADGHFCLVPYVTPTNFPRRFSGFLCGNQSITGGRGCSISIILVDCIQISNIKIFWTTFYKIDVDAGSPRSRTSTR